MDGPSRFLVQSFQEKFGGTEAPRVFRLRGART